MRLREHVGLWFLMNGWKKRGEDKEQAAVCRKRLTYAYDGIMAACKALEEMAMFPMPKLAALYLTDLWAKMDTDWWKENNEYFEQPWFVYQYGQTQGWFNKPNAEVKPCVELIRPEANGNGEIMHLRIERNLHMPEQGILFLQPITGTLSDKLAWELRCIPTQDTQYMRKVGEVYGKVMDRAVETGMKLLEAGYTLSMEEHTLHDRILAGAYEPIYPYWVFEAPNLGILYLRYPRDATLNRYVSKAGGHWNGKFMEIPVCKADALEELTQQYGFRFTAEARRRLDIWNESMRRATIYRNRKGKNKQEEPQDAFEKILERTIQVPEDLRDEL